MQDADQRIFCKVQKELALINLTFLGYILHGCMLLALRSLPISFAFSEATTTIPS